VWSEFCDWYIEIAKVQLREADESSPNATRGVLYRVLEDCLKLLHPLMPYVTEAIWDALPDRTSMLIVARWPTPGSVDIDAEAELTSAIDVIRSIRNVRSEYKVDAGKRIPAGIVAGDRLAGLERQRRIIETLARVGPFDIVESLAEPLRHAIHVLTAGVELYLPLAGMVDLDAERARGESELSRVRTQVESIDRRLGEPSFLAKAPSQVIEKERERRVSLVEQIRRLEERLASLA
ncbi:MAG TPA: class I tRNA ligase family protein, partial [Chloroflexota bacterium]|nr:class I tRNA ligase family protein [Chloroflexota bacterium]